jgi:hypothetical protein
MGYYSDFDGQWREDAEDHAAEAASWAMIRVALGPLAVALMAMLIAGAGLVAAYLSALWSLFDLHGVRWWAAAAILVAGHVLAVARFGRLFRAVRAAEDQPLPSGRELLAALNSRRAWLTRLALALLVLLALAHLLAVHRPAVFVVGIPLTAMFSMEIVALGIWRARGIAAWLDDSRGAR